MARLPVPSATIRGFQYVLENNFTGGLKTEFTGLNFPENACTSTENCTFFHTGAVFRRNGFDYESGFTTNNINRTNSAISTFIWTNAGGDGNTKLYVVQVGLTLYFYQLTNATITNPLSTTLLASTVSLTATDPTVECQYATGNGYLFVYNSTMDPIYCTFVSGVVTAHTISLQVRDFVGVLDGLALSFRPPTLSNEHQYNLKNQGWTAGSAATAQDSVNTNIQFVYNTGSQTFSLTSSAGTFAGGDIVNFSIPQPNNEYIVVAGSGGTLNNVTFNGTGTVTAFTANVSITLNVTSISLGGGTLGNTYQAFGTPGPNTQITMNFVKINQGFIGTWFTAEANYPSNADVWWQFKDSTGVFNPGTTQPNVALGSGQAPQGSFILSAFNQNRSNVSGVAGITTVSTTVRPRTGAWFAGRVFYTGVDAAFPAQGDVAQYTWTENIYFSQIVTGPQDFGSCYQNNDPTSQSLFDILPSDGGVITIQGSGSIFKLFPITNGIIVFAANGIWFISGNTGIGFTASDYTVSKISAVQSLSFTSYVDVLGYPLFWNEEGIYQIGLDSQSQGLSVNSLTLMSIKQFYDAIPKQSKKFARGSYNPITGQVQWVYRSTNESTVTDRYQFDSMLTFSMFTQAFYPWTISPGPFIHDVTYVVGVGGSASPFPVFKYLTSNLVAGTYQFTFSEERDNVNWKDWKSTGSLVDYTSNFVTGYRLHGDAQRKWQPGYVYIYSDNTQSTEYFLNGIWAFAISPNTGKYSTRQHVYHELTSGKFAKQYRRLKVRGRGVVLQLQVSSVSGKPFHIDGWSIWELQNASV